jgi:hypothetical protein
MRGASVRGPRGRCGRWAPTRELAQRLSGTDEVLLLSADELVEAGMRVLFFQEALPPSVGMLDFMTETGISATTSSRRLRRRTRWPKRARAWS